MNVASLLDFAIRHEGALFAIPGCVLGLAAWKFWLPARFRARVEPHNIQVIPVGHEQYNRIREIKPNGPGKIPVVAYLNNTADHIHVEQYGLQAVQHNKIIVEGLVSVTDVVGLSRAVGAVLIDAATGAVVRAYLNRISLLKKAAILALAVVGALLGYTIGVEHPIPKTALIDTSNLTLDFSKPNLILLIHGWKGDSDGTWLKFPALLRSDPRFSDTHVVAVNYPTYITRRNLTIGETATFLAERLEERGVARYSKIAIIAHSIGGLVARKLVLQRRHGFAALGILIEVATPHLGTKRYAQLLDDLGIRLQGNELVSEVAWDSVWLRELSNDWNSLDPTMPDQCFASPNDGLVPQESATHQCGKYHLLPSLSHTQLVKPDNAGDERYLGPALLVNTFLHPQS